MAADAESADAMHSFPVWKTSGLWPSVSQSENGFSLTLPIEVLRQDVSVGGGGLHTWSRPPPPPALLWIPPAAIR